MDAVTTLVSVPAILALVNLAKQLGVPAKIAPVLAIVLGVGLSVATHYFGSDPAFAAGASGLMLALAASGLYDVTKPKTPEDHVVTIEG